MFFKMFTITTEKKMFAEGNNILAHLTAFFPECGKARIPCELTYVTRPKSNISCGDLFGEQNASIIKQNTLSFERFI